MENPYDLFLALLAPKVWGGVVIPIRFASPYRDALLEAIDTEYLLFDDAKYVTGQVDSERFRRTIDQLVDPVVGHIEQQYGQSLGADLERFEIPMLRRTGQSLQLTRRDDAKRCDEYLRMFEPEYAGIKERFSQIFARNINPAAPHEALYAIGQLRREEIVRT
jgi:hypothetical protein